VWMGWRPGRFCAEMERREDSEDGESELSEDESGISWFDGFESKEKVDSDPVRLDRGFKGGNALSCHASITAAGANGYALLLFRGVVLLCVLECRVSSSNRLKRFMQLM
jgi:hypothetical protein